MNEITIKVSPVQNRHGGSPTMGCRAACQITGANLWLPGPYGADMYEFERKVATDLARALGYGDDLDRVHGAARSVTFRVMR